MVYKRFRLNIVLRVILISGLMYLLFYLVLQTKYYAATLIVACLTLYQIYALIYYVEKTNRDLTRFLDAIKYSDFSQSFSAAELSSSFQSLNAAFTAVLDRFREARAEKEEHFRYLQTVVQHVGIGLLAFRHDGAVELINTAAKRLLRMPHVRNIHALEKLSPALVQTLLTLKSGERRLVRVSGGDELLQLAIHGTEFRMREQKITLVSLQNIQSELEEKEMEAWQNLIRVLTHEIMNSVTPISSLASTTNGLLQGLRNQARELLANHHDLDTFEDISSALQTIERRSKGLLHFIDAYRSLTKIPAPHFQVFSVRELFARVRRLLNERIEATHIVFETAVEPNTLKLTADPELIEQVLINLVMNAIHSVESCSGPCITLRGRIDERSRVMVQVEDNGPGIPAEVLEKIFIPFFTTKPGGTGIGLSLSRQIMRLHRGSISVKSEARVRTIFTLRF